MLHSNANKDLGFTLIESLVVLAIVGIALAMAIPSSIAAINRAKLAQSTDLVVASLQEAQIEAIRRNKNCTLTLDKVNRKISGQQGCLLSGDRILPDSIDLDYTGASGEIQYGIRGNTTTNKSIILKVSGNSNNARCLTVSAPLGIIRLGSYNNVTNSCDKLNN
ncbi:type II secretion system protein [Chamaesiphon sp. VAR_48_metabat_403]|uniref:GspH/FimT family pseudopilin n=1 Tax=Chamaesiphon sp. VAR_48_metabat_403 TaxID=2964700 RepID=UPI00286DA765|nr:type II secretion system protein [Chamaesiphon sp. VAR_48_metabat_403]